MKTAYSTTTWSLDITADLLKYEHARLTAKVNYLLIPTTVFLFTEDNCVLFNNYASCLYASPYNKIKRTRSGGISYDTVTPAYDIRNTQACIEITIMDLHGMWRLQWRNTASVCKKRDKLTMTGHKAFVEFKKICKKFHINLTDYEHTPEQGLKDKELIQKLPIKIRSKFVLDQVYENAHHIDFHSSFMSGLVRKHPEFGPVVKYIYDNRKNDDLKFKAILNMTQGYMQSNHVDYKYAHLSKDMIDDNNERIQTLFDALLQGGRQVLLFNTDGIWYAGEVYHGPGEGPNICEWENDHINCTFRAKSDGAYEFIENGIYHPVIRGQSRLDRLKPRESWEWGDIYKIDAEPIIFKFSKGFIWFNDTLKGVIEYAEKEKI